MLNQETTALFLHRVLHQAIHGDAGALHLVFTGFQPTVIGLCSFLRTPPEVVKGC